MVVNESVNDLEEPYGDRPAPLAFHIVVVEKDLVYDVTCIDPGEIASEIEGDHRCVHVASHYNTNIGIHIADAT
jgi:hypothetical protein